jgi:hypothetical protein
MSENGETALLGGRRPLIEQIRCEWKSGVVDMVNVAYGSAVIGPDTLPVPEISDATLARLLDRVRPAVDAATLLIWHPHFTDTYAHNAHMHIRERTLLHSYQFLVARAIIDGDAATFQMTVPSGAKPIELCELWATVCQRFWTDPIHEAGLVFDSSLAAARLVAGFVRVGLPMRAPFQRPDTIAASTPPLCTAVRYSPDIALALLNLPDGCGLDVSAVNPILGYDLGPALGHTNSPRNPMGRGSHDIELFDRLLHRTERSVVSSASVYVQRDCSQYDLQNVHVLVSNILRCSYCASRILEIFGTSRGLEMSRVFISHAQPDGSGTDLTGGTPRQETTPWWNIDGEVGMPPASILWPNGKFEGSLALADTLHRWWSQVRTRFRRLIRTREPVSAIVDAYQTIRSLLMTALRRIRNYRHFVKPMVADRLHTAGIYVRGVTDLVAAYVLVPLHDESQLLHPLLGHTPDPSIHRCCL